MFHPSSEKTKALISFAVIAKLICFFVFAYAKNPVFSCHSSYVIQLKQVNKACHEKTCSLYMQKQRQIPGVQ